MTEKTENTDSVITSWMVLSCAVLNSYEPMRFAGTWKQYSKNAMPQLAIITFHKASLRYFKWPYHAKVMKIFEMASSRMVRTNPPYEFDENQRIEKGKRQLREYAPARDRGYKSCLPQPYRIRASCLPEKNDCGENGHACAEGISEGSI